MGKVPARANRRRALDAARMTGELRERDLAFPRAGRLSRPEVMTQCKCGRRRLARLQPNHGRPVSFVEHVGTEYQLENFAEIKTHTNYPFLDVLFLGNPRW